MQKNNCHARARGPASYVGARLWHRGGPDAALFSGSCGDPQRERERCCSWQFEFY